MELSTHGTALSITHAGLLPPYPLFPHQQPPWISLNSLRDTQFSRVTNDPSLLQAPHTLAQLQLLVSPNSAPSGWSLGPSLHPRKSCSPFSWNLHRHLRQNSPFRCSPKAHLHAVFPTGLWTPRGQESFLLHHGLLKAYPHCSAHSRASANGSCTDNVGQYRGQKASLPTLGRVTIQAKGQKPLARGTHHQRAQQGPYPFIEALQELDLICQGVHLGLELDLVHVGGIHILGNTERDLPLPLPSLLPQGAPSSLLSPLPPRFTGRPDA